MTHRKHIGQTLGEAQTALKKFKLPSACRLELQQAEPNIGLHWGAAG